MTATRLTAIDSERLIDAADFVTKTAASGEISPTQALAQAIDRYKLNEGEATLVANNYNVGASVEHMHSAKTATAAFSSFELADARQALELCQKRTAKTAAAQAQGWAVETDAADDFEKAPSELRPKPTVKIAERLFKDEPKPELEEDFSHLAYRLKTAERAVDDAEIDERILETKLQRKLAEVRYWFQTEGRELSVASLKLACSDDVAATVALDGLHVPAHAGRRHGSYAELAEPIRMAGEAGETLKQAAALQEQIQAKRDSLQTVKRAYEIRVHALSPEPLRADRHDDKLEPVALKALDTSFLKLGSILPALFATQAVSAYNGLSDQMRTQGKEQVQSTLNSLEDVGQQQRLAGVELSTMLAELMSDPDSPIAGRSRDEVLGHYNDLIRIAPALSARPSTLKPWLVRSLSGEMSPFEIEQALNADEKVRKGSGMNPYHNLAGLK